MTDNSNKELSLEGLIKDPNEDRITEMFSKEITRLEGVYLSQIVPKFIKHLESNYGKGKIKCTKPIVGPTKDIVISLYQILADNKNIGNLRVVYVDNKDSKQKNRKLEEYERVYAGHLSPNSDDTMIHWRKDKGRIDSYINIPFE